MPEARIPNFGCPNVMFGAPGEGVITTYPGGNYAAAWGTSFSAPIVAGAIALLEQQNPTIQLGGIINALWRAVRIPQMGHGRLDLFQALAGTGEADGGDDGCSGGNGGGDGGGGGGHDGGGGDHGGGHDGGGGHGH